MRAFRTENRKVTFFHLKITERFFDSKQKGWIKTAYLSSSQLVLAKLGLLTKCQISPKGNSCRVYASVNSGSAHPPRALALFKRIGPIPRGGNEKRGQMPRPRDRRLPTLLQFFY